MKNLALSIAADAHKHDVRKGGEPYMNHVLRVAGKFKEYDVRHVVALLHDVIEDHPEFSVMIKSVFPPLVVESLALLDRNLSGSYYDYIAWIADSGNPVAMDVKIADLEDNLRDHKAGNRKDKYMFALSILSMAKLNLAKS